MLFPVCFGGLSQGSGLFGERLQAYGAQTYSKNITAHSKFQFRSAGFRAHRRMRGGAGMDCMGMGKRPFLRYQWMTIVGSGGSIPSLFFPR